VKGYGGSAGKDKWAWARKKKIKKERKGAAGWAGRMDCKGEEGIGQGRERGPRDRGKGFFLEEK
jgi:hypothetical protein